MFNAVKLELCVHLIETDIEIDIIKSKAYTLWIKNLYQLWQ